MEQLYCAAADCRCPIDMDALANSIYVGYSIRLCAVCFDMFLAVASRAWFIKAQGEWNRGEVKRRGLLPGANYLND